MRRWALALAVLAGCGRSGAPRDAAHPDVLVVVLDTLRADRVGANGYPRPTTPALDGLAARGTLARDVWANSSWTLPSHVSLFTGLLPSEHGVHRPARSDAIARATPFEQRLGLIPALSDNVRTLAELYAARGYRTALYSSNPWIRGQATTRGFGAVGGSNDQDAATVAAAAAELGGAEAVFLVVNLTSAHSPYPLLGKAECGWIPDETRAWWRPDAVVPDGVAAWVERASASRGARLHLHEDVQWPAAADGQQVAVSDLYDCAVRAADRGLEALLARWAEAGRDGYVVVVGDHGEYLGEHGLLQHPNAVYDEGLRVPAVVVGPGVPRQVIDTPLSLVDVHATLAAWAGAPAPAGSRARGVFDATSRVRVAESYPHDLDGFREVRQRAERDGASLVRRYCSGAGCPVVVGPEGAAAAALLVALPQPAEVSLDHAAPLDPADVEALKSLGYVE